VHLQGSTFQKNDAILLGLFIKLSLGCLSLLTCWELCLKIVSKELAHTLLVSTVFEVHVRHKTLRLRISIRTLEEHSQVM